MVNTNREERNRSAHVLNHKGIVSLVQSDSVVINQMTDINLHEVAFCNSHQNEFDEILDNYVEMDLLIIDQLTENDLFIRDMKGRVISRSMSSPQRHLADKTKHYRVEFVDLTPDQRRNLQQYLTK